MKLFSEEFNGKKLNIVIMAAIVLVLVLTGKVPFDTKAAAQSVSFSADSFEMNVDERLAVDVSLDSDEDISTYSVKIKYDTNRLKYVEGADYEESEGILKLEGTGFGNKVKYTLTFDSTSGGEAGMMVMNASLFGEESNKEITITELPKATVKINGENKAGASFFENEKVSKDSTATFYTDSGIPIVCELSLDNGKNTKVVDVSAYKPDMDAWKYKLTKTNYLGREMPCITDNSENCKFLVCVDEKENFTLLAVNNEGTGLYPVSVIKAGDKIYYCASINCCATLPQGYDVAAGTVGDVFYGIDADGNGDFFKYSMSGNLIHWDDSMDAAGEKITEVLSGASGANAGIIVAVVVVIAAAFAAVLIYRKKRRNRYSDITEGQNDLSITREERRRQYFFVIRELTSREIKRKYARSFLGIIWSVLNPLLTMIVMSLIFSYMFSRSIENFPLYYLTGSIFWTLFSVGTNSSMTALVDNKNLLLKAKLPKQTFVLSRVYTSLVNFGYTCIAYVLMLIVFRVTPSPLMLLFIPAVLLMLIFTLGIGYILSILYVFFGDIKYLYGVLLTLVMYCSAIFYPVSSLPPVIQNVIEYNPIYLAMYIAREAVVYGNVPDYMAWVKLIIAAAASLILGLIVFKKKENDVMQRI